MQITIVYWSGTGNTEEMANLIKQGAEKAGADVTLNFVSDASQDDPANCDVLVLGCPSMGAEVLEESEFEPYMESIESAISGRKVALFGSYGWGDGEWMRDWTQRVENAGAVLVYDSLIVNEKPEGEDVDKCIAMGEAIAKM